MEHLKELYDNNKPLFYDLMKDRIKVTLKINGRGLQVYYNKDLDEIEFHECTKITTELGPKVSEYTKMMDKCYSDAIDTINDHLDEVKKYDFMIFELVKDNMILVTCIKDEKLIDEQDDLKNVAKSINGVKLVPVVFDGKLSVEQQVQLTSWCSDPNMSSNLDFYQFIKDLFDDNSESKVSFPTKEYNDMKAFVEGVVIDFYTSTKIAQYKLMDQKYMADYKGKVDNAKAEAEESLSPLREYMAKFNDDSDDKINSFLKMVSNPKRWSKLVELGAKVPLSEFDDPYYINKNLPDDVKKILRRGGVPMYIVWKEFMKKH